MKRLKVCLLITVISTCYIFSQELSRTVIATSGGELSNSSTQISSTIGEPISGTYSNSSCVMNLGFQQVHIEVSSLNPEVTMFDLNVYPNPVSSFLNIEIENAKVQNYNAVLLDLDGKKIGEYNFNKNSMNLDVNDLPQSIYILQIYNEQGSMQTFKLIKN